MGLTLITGRAGADTEQSVRTHLEAASRAGRESVLVLPGFADVRRAREEIAQAVPLGIDVTTFEQWLEALWRRGGDGRQLISAVLRTNLVNQACASATTPLERVATSPGFHELVSKIASRSAGLERTSDGECITAALNDILRRYERSVRELGLVEPGEAARVLSETVPIHGVTVAWSRFTDLSTTQLRFIGALAGSNDVLVALTWAERSAGTEALDATVEELVQIANEHVTVACPAPASELGEIERSLFAPLEPLLPTGQVTLSEAVGPEAEAVLVARAARRAIEGGIDSSKVAVVFRDLAPRRDLVETALRASGVAFVVDFQVEFASTPLGSALLALASVVTGSGGRVELLHFLQGPFSDAGPGDVERLDAQWRRYREIECGRLMAGAAGLSEAVRRVIRLAKAVCERPITVANVEKWQQLSALMLSLATRGGVRHEGDTRLDVAVHGRLMETAAQVAASGAEVSGQALLAGMARSPISSGSSEQPGAVTVTDAHRIRSRSFDVVILGGLTAAEFSSEKREPLAATLLGRMGLSPGMDERLAERMLYYLVVTRASRRLELVRQSTDAAGNALRPSVFWEETRDLYRTAAEAAAGEDGLLGVTHTLRLSELESAAPALLARRGHARHEAASGHLRPPGLSRGRIARAPALWPAGGEFSVTELEQYLGCPYQWFYGRVIRPAEVDRTFDARSVGSYAHALLTGFYNRFHEAGHVRVTAENLPTALELYERLADELTGDPKWATRTLREELAASSARGWVRSAIEQDTELLDGFHPVAHEWSFGEDAGRPFEMGGVRLRGKLDRVDAGTAGVVVTDYKSSAAVHGHGAFESKRLLQAVVYAQAAATGFAAAPVSGMYRSLRSGELRGFWNEEIAPSDACVKPADVVTHERVSEMTGEIEARIARATDDIREGRIAPHPADRSVCEHCGARAFCREGAS